MTAKLKINWKRIAERRDERVDELQAVASEFIDTLPVIIDQLRLILEMASERNQLNAKIIKLEARIKSLEELLGDDR